MFEYHILASQLQN